MDAVISYAFCLRQRQMIFQEIPTLKPRVWSFNVPQQQPKKSRYNQPRIEISFIECLSNIPDCILNSSVIKLHNCPRAKVMFMLRSEIIPCGKGFWTAQRSTPFICPRANNKALRNLRKQVQRIDTTFSCETDGRNLSWRIVSRVNTESLCRLSSSQMAWSPFLRKWFSASRPHHVFLFWEIITRKKTYGDGVWCLL